MDFTERYNTPLEPFEETQYQDWARASGRDPVKERYDYDLQGLWKQQQTQNPMGAEPMGDGHFPDTFKKPNHPTFSTFSQYHGEDGLEGGEWTQHPDQTWTFAPGRTNIENHGLDGLKDYFGRVEPGNHLALPVDHDPFEAAAARVRAPYAKANARVSGLPDVLDYFGNKIVSAATAPMDAYTGKLQVSDPSTGMPTPEAMKRAGDVAQATFLGGMPASEAGGVGIFGGKLGNLDASVQAGLSKPSSVTIGPDPVVQAIKDALSGKSGPVYTMKDPETRWTAIQKAYEDSGGAGYDPSIPMAARAGGFTQKVYRGLSRPFDQERHIPSETYFTAHPELAMLYSGLPPDVARRGVHTPEFNEFLSAGRIVPALLKTDSYHVVDAGGRVWDGEGGVVMREAINHATKNNLPGVIVKNIFDEPIGTTTYLGEPKDVYIPLHGNTARHEKAEFDPSKYHLNDFLAGIGGIAVLGGVGGHIVKDRDGQLHHAVPVEHDPF